METGIFYKIINNKEVFAKDTILLLGDTDSMEFFDITTEISTGHSYSSCEVNVENLKKLDDKTQAELKQIFNEYFRNNYKINQNILKY